MNTPEQPLTRPASLADLFFSFTVLSLQGFGGVHAVVQRELVEKKRWLSKEEFIGDWAVAQIMPGANVVNLSIMIGGRYFAVPGALAALAGLLLVPAMLLVLLALAYAHYAGHPQVAGALRGIGAATAGIVFAAAFKLVPALRASLLPTWLCAVFVLGAFVLIGLLHLPLLPVLTGLGVIACLLTYRRLTP